MPFEIMRKYTVEPSRSQRIIQCTWIACWIHKAVSIHSEYVILTDFLLQLHECISNLHYTDMACHVIPYHWLTHLLAYLPLFPTQMHNPSNVATDTRTWLYWHCDKVSPFQTTLTSFQNSACCSQCCDDWVV